MNGGDQNRFVFQMDRVLSIARLMEARCQGLFTGLIAAQRHGREEAAKKKKKYRKEREEMRLELTAAQCAPCCRPRLFARHPLQQLLLVGQHLREGCLLLLTELLQGRIFISGHNQMMIS